MYLSNPKNIVYTKNRDVFTLAVDLYHTSNLSISSRHTISDIINQNAIGEMEKVSTSPHKGPSAHKGLSPNKSPHNRARVES